MQRTAVLASFALLLGAAGCGGAPPAAPTADANLAGKTYTTYGEAAAAGKQENKPVLLVAYQGSENSVNMMLLSDPGITERSSKLVVAKLDAATQAADLGKLGVREYPTVIVLRPDGTPVWRMKGASPMQLIPVLDQVLGVARGQ